jgi:hypothetical protein
VQLLTAGTGDQPQVVVLHGPPGFGKTYLAQLVLDDDRVRRRFPQRIFWTGLRQGQQGTDPAAAIVDVAARVTGGEREPMLRR